MIHFFLTMSSDGSNSPFAHALRELQIPHRIFSGKVLLRYRWRVWLLVVGLPRLATFAMRSAWRSLVRAKPAPEAVVVGSHIEALVFALASRLLRRHTRVVLIGFIFTRRENRWLDAARRAYFDRLFSTIDAVLCHSSLVRHHFGLLAMMPPGHKGKPH